MILSKLAPADVIGWYGAAKNIMGTLLAPALILGAASFPRLARAAGHAGALKAEVRAAPRPILWLGALAATGTTLFADDAIAIMYGQKQFGPAGIIFQIGLTALTISASATSCSRRFCSHSDRYSRAHRAPIPDLTSS